MDVFRRLYFNLAYFGNPPWESGVSPPELMEFIQNHVTGRALDLGCGTGTNCITLAQHGWQAVGVDYVGRAIRAARRKARQAGVEVDFRQEDITRLNQVHGPFDLILDMGCFHSLSDAGREAYLDNLNRLLAAGGTFLMYALFREANDLPPGIVEHDLEGFTRYLNLVHRKDGMERKVKPSAWFMYERSSRSVEPGI